MNGRKVAFLGTGLMGAPMARNLARAGHAVAAWNRTAGKAEALRPDGVEVAASPSEAVRGAEFVIAIVSDGAAVADLLFAQGVAEAMAEGAIFVDMSSITPDQARDHAQRLEALGIVQIDAPVSGGTKGAEAATLAIMAGGPAEAFARAEPMLKALGRPVHVGPAGSGQLAKLANQAIVGITIGAVAEAILLVEAGGGDPAAFRDALKGGFADSTILQLHGRRMSEGDYTPGAKSSVQLKDMNNIVAEAESRGIGLPLASAVRERYRRLVGEMDGADLDHSALYLELKEHGGDG